MRSSRIHINYLLLSLLFMLPSLLHAQEGRRKLTTAQKKIVKIYFTVCHKDSQNCDKHVAIMKDDSFLTEEILDKRMVANINGSYSHPYSKYFERVHDIPARDFELLGKALKKGIGEPEMFSIEVIEKGQTKKYDLYFYKSTVLPKKLLSQYNKIEALAMDIRKAQNAYDRKAIILNNH